MTVVRLRNMGIVTSSTVGEKRYIKCKYDILIGQEYAHRTKILNLNTPRCKKLY